MNPLFRDALLNIGAALYGGDPDADEAVGEGDERA